MFSVEEGKIVLQKNRVWEYLFCIECRRRKEWRGSRKNQPLGQQVKRELMGRKGETTICYTDVRCTHIHCTYITGGSSCYTRVLHSLCKNNSGLLCVLICLVFGNFAWTCYYGCWCIIIVHMLKAWVLHIYVTFMFQFCGHVLLLRIGGSCHILVICI